MKKLIFIAAILLLTGCSHDESPERKEITVSAAASLKDALSVIEKDYEKTHDVDIKFNYGASCALANQIKAGAPVDLFFLPPKVKWMIWSWRTSSKRKISRVSLEINLFSSVNRV